MLYNAVSRLPAAAAILATVNMLCFRRRRRFWHCVAPYVNITLHRGWFWAKSAASGSVRWCCFRSCRMVLSHVMRGWPSCLLQSAGGEANRILLASALSSMRIICPNRVSRHDWIIAVSCVLQWDQSEGASSSAMHCWYDRNWTAVQIWWWVTYTRDMLSLLLQFLPHSAMQAQSVPSCSVWLSVCLSVCLSVRHVREFSQNE